MLTDNNKLDFSILSYNSQGSGPGKLEYISQLLHDHDLVLLQKHWLMASQFGIYSQQIKDCYSHCISAMSSTEILQGRPYGGCSILWKKNLVACVSPISTVSKRLCAIMIMMNNVSLLLCNVYMPTGTSASSMEEYRSVLNKIKSIILNNNCIYVIIGGDFNTDFSKTGGNVNQLKLFIEKENLKAALDHEVNKVLFTYESKSNMSKSLIDHFLINESLLQNVDVYKLLHDVNNFSVSLSYFYNF